MPMGWLNSVDIGHAATMTLHNLAAPETEAIVMIDNGYRFGVEKIQVERDVETVKALRAQVEAGSSSLHSDNQNVYLWLKQWRAKTPLATEILRRI